jgi:hypothetical protein
MDSAEAQLAIDGSSDTQVASCSRTIPQTNPWFAIDLGSSQLVKGMYITQPAAPESETRVQALSVGLRG